MGAIFSKKEPGGFEKLLEKIDHQISTLEATQKNRRAQQRKILYSLLLYSLVVEVVIGIWFYFHQKPSDVLGRCVHASPLVGFPIVVYLLKVIISAWYARTIKRDEAKLVDLRKQLKSKLEERKKATDFEATQKLLRKYEQMTEQSNSPSPKKKQQATEQVAPQPTTQPSTLHQRLPHQVAHQPNNPRSSHNSNFNNNNAPSSAFPQQQQFRPPQANPAPPRSGFWGLLDKVVDNMVGANGFALICSNCKAHNGLAPAGELSAIQFRCRFCGQLNGDIPEIANPAQPFSSSSSSSSSTSSPVTSHVPPSINNNNNNDDDNNGSTNNNESNIVNNDETTTEGGLRQRTR